MSYTIVIIGGYGEMGQIFAKIFQKEGHRVILTGPNEDKGREIAAQINVEYSKDNKISEIADITIITVPIEKTISVIKEVAPIIKDDSLIIDLTSVKKDVCDALEKFTNPKAEIISIHPMFGPKISSIEGQVFVVLPVRIKKEGWINYIYDFLATHKTKFVEATPEEHDRIMAVIQGLTHFAYISLGDTLRELNFNIKDSRKFASPIYNLMLDIIGRILGQNPWMYAHIQMDNDETKEVRRTFLKCAERLNEIIEKKDDKKFADIMKLSAKHFSDVNGAMNRSNKAIMAQDMELKILNKNLNKEIFVENIYTNNVHYGILKYFDGENLKLFKNKITLNLKISNVRILNDDESLNIKKKIFGTVKRDFSLLIHDDIDEEIILRCISGDFKKENEIVDVNIKEIFRSEKFKDKKSVCYEILFINRNLKEKENKVKEMLSKIGKLR